MRVYRWGIFFVCLFSFNSFASVLNELPKNEKIRLFSIHGSNTIGAEMAPNLLKQWFSSQKLSNIQRVDTGVENEQIIRAYQPKLNTTVELLVTAPGSGTGYQYLLTGEGDIAASSRPINNKEAEQLATFGDMRSNQTEHIVAIDGLAVIVNKNNPIAQLSTQTIADIFSGKLRNWAEVGGMNAPINLYARDHQSGTWDSFKSMVLGKQLLSDQARRYASSAQLSDSVAADKQGIGFVGLASVNSAKLLAVFDGSSRALHPNSLTVATEDYVLSRRLFMYSLNNAKPAVQEFLRFTLTDSGQNVVADVGFISQKIDTVLPEFYDSLPFELREFTNGAKRLTLNFRFDQGSARIDNKALVDVQRLVEYFKHNPQQQLLLIGFGDPKKTEARSQLLSRLRAMAVRRELMKEGIFTQDILGFGDNLLVANVNETEGQVRNRRVEVWVR